MAQKTSKYPVAIDPNGHEHTVIFWTNKGMWEWWGFSKSHADTKNGEYFNDHEPYVWNGYVMGAKCAEFGSFSEKELKDLGCVFHTDPKDLKVLAPPACINEDTSLGQSWTWKK